MSVVDICLLVIMGAFVLFGLLFGFIHTLGSTLGSVAGVILASRALAPAYEAYGSWLGGGLVGKVVLFAILFFLISRGIGFLFYLAEKFFDLLKVIPFLSTINHLLGGVLGAVEGVIAAAALVAVAVAFVQPGAFADALASSMIVQRLLALVRTVSFLFPEQMRMIFEEGPKLLKHVL